MGILTATRLRATLRKLAFEPYKEEVHKKKYFILLPSSFFLLPSSFIDKFHLARNTQFKGFFATPCHTEA